MQRSNRIGYRKTRDRATLKKTDKTNVIKIDSFQIHLTLEVAWLKNQAQSNYIQVMR